MVRRPPEMRVVGLTRYEYQLIGEIVVISGILEQFLKEDIVRLVKAPWPDGLALTAHLNFTSMCDIALSLIPGCVPPECEGYSLREVYTNTLKEARDLYQERNDIVHGPFSIWPATTGTKKSTFRISARGRLSAKGHTVSAETLADLLRRMISNYEALFGCAILLEQEREKQGLGHQLPRSLDPEWKASPQKRLGHQQTKPGRSK